MKYRLPLFWFLAVVVLGCGENRIIGPKVDPLLGSWERTSHAHVFNAAETGPVDGKILERITFADSTFHVRHRLADASEETLLPIGTTMYEASGAWRWIEARIVELRIDKAGRRGARGEWRKLDRVMFEAVVSVFGDFLSLGERNYERARK